jgi:Type IV secretion system pilin
MNKYFKILASLALFLIMTVSGAIPIANVSADDDSYPTLGAVCKNSATTSTIWWTTKAKTGANIFVSDKDGGSPYSSTNFKLTTTHSFKFNSTKDHHYTYTAESYDKDGKAIPNTKTGEISFVGAADSETGCKDYEAGKTPASTGSTNANTNASNNSTPNSQINTGTSFKFSGSLDETIGSFFNPLNVKSVPELITSIIRVLFALISIAAVIVIIISGFRMVLASGEPEALNKAKKAISWAIIGLIVSLMSFSIVAIIQNLIDRQ